jgi:hypothetical protein
LRQSAETVLQVCLLQPGVPLSRSASLGSFGLLDQPECGFGAGNDFEAPDSCP